MQPTLKETRSVALRNTSLPLVRNLLGTHCHINLKQLRYARCLTRNFPATSRRPLSRHAASSSSPGGSDPLACLELTDAESQAVLDIIDKTAARDVGSSVQALVTYTGSRSAARSLATRHPHLLCCQLPSWIEFLTAFGLTKPQVQHVLTQHPEALLAGDLLAAGGALATLRRLGLEQAAAAQLVTYYPQLLHKDEAEIRTMLSIMGKFQTGVF